MLVQCFSTTSQNTVSLLQLSAMASFMGLFRRWLEPSDEDDKTINLTLKTEYKILPDENAELNVNTCTITNSDNQGQLTPSDGQHSNNKVIADRV